MTQTLTIPHSKPRNPLVAASLKRLAGAHRVSAGGQRQSERRALRQELTRLEPLRHRP